MGKEHILRKGGWSTFSLSPEFLFMYKTSYRYHYFSFGCYDDFGFRLVYRRKA